MENVFKDFSQADGSTTRKYGGTGLGLGISRRLVEAMGGHLSVTSKVGHGSVFRFTAQLPSGEDKRRAPRDDVKDFHGLPVLIIDDNATNCLILRETLASWGMTGVGVSTAKKGADELRQATSGGVPYAMVLLDRQMPDMDGFAAINLLRMAAPAIPIVMLTSECHSGDAQKRRDSTLSGYAVKPVKRADLLRLFCNALETSSEIEPAGQSQAIGFSETIVPVGPLRILIAEDSPDNRLLLTAYLRSSPYLLTFVKNGQQALERFSAGSFDVVLMDMQMPILDGLAATRAIREFEHLHGRVETPVIALTANALAHDSEASHMAGCNAHLSKPISKQKLLSAIEQFRRSRDEGKANEPLLIEAPEGLEEYVHVYLEARKQEASILTQLLAASDFAGIRRIAHDIKGTGTSFGFPELSSIGDSLQSSATGANKPEVTRQLHLLGDYLSRVRIADTLPR